ncbi:MAG: hypothetical protein AMJ95_05690 [Omnitrophica WOR_2 bacterium SM23_72]|nr:MAG: hypothetical protein AMJ95_05690 [Omnitrophica WOR_2 bacterium SM23_72]
MKRVFFLGAGFSNLAGFPLGAELLHFVRQKLASSVELMDQQVYLPILEQTIEIFKSSGRSFFANNLELLLTSFTLSLSYNDTEFIDKFKPIYETYISSGDKRYFFPQHVIGRITYGIRSAFRNHHILISGYGESPPIADQEKAEIYNKFFNMLGSEDTIITLNYDILCEQALWNNDKWTFLDGYGFNKTKESLMGSDNVGLYVKPEKSIVKIYKLHGSINWAEDYEKNEGIILTDLLVFSKSFKGRNTEDNKIGASEINRLILPNYSRSFIKQHAILEIWKAAKKSISECDELYFIGYGLSDIDSSLQFLLYDSISSNIKLNKESIFVIDNQSIEHTFAFSEKSVFLRYSRFLNDKCTFIKQSFKDWILGIRVVEQDALKK